MPNPFLFCVSGGAFCYLLLMKLKMFGPILYQIFYLLLNDGYVKQVYNNTLVDLTLKKKMKGNRMFETVSPETP